MRYNYWSSSFVAQWLRSFVKIEKPKAATSSDWRKWNKDFKSNYPIIYWITEEGLNKLQNIVMWPIDTLNNLYYAINARFKDRYFGMSSDLDKWKYHEIDTRILHCNFQTLVDFVESEGAHMASWSAKEKGKDYGIKWYHSGWISLFAPKWRSKEAGLDHLAWEMSLIFDDESYGNYGPHIEEAKASGKYGTPTPQAISAKETYDLYMWWTVTRPARPDPFEVSGLKAIYEKKRDGDILDDLDEPISNNRKDGYDIMNRLEEQYEKEDEEMLIRLIKHRRYLWT